MLSPEVVDSLHEKEPYFDYGSLTIVEPLSEIFMNEFIFLNRFKFEFLRGIAKIKSRKCISYLWKGLDAQVVNISMK